MACPSEQLFLQRGNTIQLQGPLDLSDRVQVEAIRLAARAIAEAGRSEVVLDFSRTRFLSSSIMSLTLLVGRELQDTDARLRVRASMMSHRTLVAAGITAFVELNLCG